MLAAEERRQAWLESTPGAKENIAALGAIHHAALNSGLVDTSPEYFHFMESQLAALQQPAEAATHMAEEMQERAAQSRTPEPPPRPKPVRYSAPRKPRRSECQWQAATPAGSRSRPARLRQPAIAGITLEEYAKQKMRLAAMKASGEYGETTDDEQKDP